MYIKLYNSIVIASKLIVRVLLYVYCTSVHNWNGQIVDVLAFRKTLSNIYSVNILCIYKGIKQNKTTIK